MAARVESATGRPRTDAAKVCHLSDERTRQWYVCCSKRCCPSMSDFMPESETHGQAPFKNTHSPLVRPELLRDFGVPAISRLESRLTSAFARRLHSRSSGTAGAERVPFVLLHGLVISSLYMIPLAECIAETHEVHALDLPGFGRSEGPRDVLSIPQLADWVLAWMSEVGLQQAHGVGNSLGCESLLTSPSKRLKE